MATGIQGYWARITKRFAKPRGLEAQAALSQAYQSVFLGRPTQEEQQTVLADLLAKSGFQKVTPARGTADQEIWQQEGKRALFAEIFAHLTLTDADLLELQYAARREAAADEAYEGTNLT